VRTLSMRHRLQIRILSAMNKEQTKKRCGERKQ
jgi:hypothetical protein